MSEQEFWSYINQYRDIRVWGKNQHGAWYLNDSVLEHLDDVGVDDVRLDANLDYNFIKTKSRAPKVDENEYVLIDRGWVD